ncbi:MAG: Ig-like domain-containing protein [Clostridia bacterium]|nr:Ig-like domain-containing protein [Clostridia bacterium]
MKRLIPLILMVTLLVCGLSCTALAENKFYFDKTYNKAFEGEELQLVLIREGDCADDGELTFRSSAKKVATVDEFGTVQALAKGQTTITASLKGAKRTWTAQITVTVAKRVESIELTSKVTVYDEWDAAVADSVSHDSEYSGLPVLLMQAGKQVNITASCKPSNASNRKWELTTSDDTIVRAGGTYFAPKKAGECLVTVQSVQNPEVRLEYRALVVQPVTKVRVTSDVKSLYVGESLVLDAEITPADATIRNVTWSADRPDNASVDEYGVVTGVSKGNAVITAKAADGSGRYGTFTVTVKQQPEEITLNKPDVSLKTGNYVTLTPTVLPSTTNDKTVTWSTSDASVAKVSTGGRVTAVSPGVAIITCESKTHPEIYAQAVVSVYQPVTKVAFTDKNPYVAVGDTIHLNWTVTPDTATDTSVTFSTNKENVVHVGQDGAVTGLKRGECYVYATANDGSGKKATIKVQVTQPVEGVGIKYDERSVGVGSTVTNNAIFYPEDASITKMQWYAEDATIASVSGTGSKVTVTGRNWGETSIIGVTEDGSYVTTFQVKVGDVNKPLNIANLYVEDGDTIRIQVYNESNMTITRFYYVIETFDAWGNPLVCNDDGRSNDFEGYYGYTLEPGTATRHGRFTFGGEFNRPAYEDIGMVTMRITGYVTEDGETVYVQRANQEKFEWKVKVLSSEEK